MAEEAEVASFEANSEAHRVEAIEAAKDEAVGAELSPTSQLSPVSRVMATPNGLTSREPLTNLHSLRAGNTGVLGRLQIGVKNL